MSPRLKDQTSDLKTRIIAVAWKQIAESGPAALSLRAIARDLSITAPAIYNYFPDRDALVTALIIEAYLSLGDAQFSARDASPAADPAGRIWATGQAYRQWAINDPQRYQLIFGAPIPGYVAPFDQVFPAAARSLGALVSIIEDLRVSGRLDCTGLPLPPPDLDPQFQAWKTHGGDAQIVSLSVAVLIWSRVHGLVSLEIANAFPPYGPSAQAMYDYELTTIIRNFMKE
ncbi:MAG: TetR/AcrR family transcriptional regulator [Anaerolineales bacterium]|jgi:AcrR family transcriptional regulator|nr:TetR/AcrR family transcriptional regulator [Anaerolineales bacterium]